MQNIKIQEFTQILAVILSPHDFSVWPKIAQIRVKFWREVYHHMLFYKPKTAITVVKPADG